MRMAETNWLQVRDHADEEVLAMWRVAAEETRMPMQDGRA